MIVEIIRAIIQKIMSDKIIMGLIAICIAGIFFSGANHSEKAETVQSKRLGRSSADQPLRPGEQAVENPDGDPDQQGKAAGQNAAGQNAAGQNAAQPALQAGLTPQLASEFVHWWIGKAMDYRMDTAVASHKEATAWMLPEASNAFDQFYWGEHIKQGIASGQIVGSFQPVSIQPVATNPDGTVVVTVVGTLVMQQSGQQPAGQQLTMDFLVKKGADGCRVAAFFNRAVAPVAAR